MQPQHQPSTPARDRLTGCLLGGAVGDALGAPVEFIRSLAEIRRRFGPKGATGYEEAYGRRGAITDDTQMTLFTAEGLIRADNRWLDRGIVSMPHVVHNAYRRWLLTQGEQPRPFSDFRDGCLQTGWLIEQQVLHSPRAPGNTCLSALRGSRAGTIEEPLNESKGCGGIMRIAPVGLVSNNPFQHGAELAALTHGHPSGYLAAGAFAVIISQLFQGTSLHDAIDAALRELSRAQGHGETTEAIERARSAAIEQPANAERVESLGEGWVAEEALAISLFCALTAPDFPSGVLLAVNHGGDSDSTGSLTGQLLGTWWGAGAIPQAWLDELEARDILEQVAEDLIRHFVDPPEAPPAPREWPMGVSWPQPDDLDRYPPN